MHYILSFPVVDISAMLGLCATIVLTINCLFGILLGTAYKTFPYWQRLPANIKKISVLQVHNVTAYIALGLLLLHPAVLLLDPVTKFRLVSIVLPFEAPVQKVWVSLGIVAMYSIVLVIITTQKTVKNRMRFRTWKNIHLVSYLTAILFCIHGMFMDPELKNRPPDLLDAEKLVSEMCLLLLIAAAVFRYRYYLAKQLIVRNR